MASFIPDCTQNSGKIEAAVMHTITDLKHAQMIKYHFKNNQPVHTTFSMQVIATEMTRIVNPGSPATHLEFSWDDNTNVISVVGKDGEPSTGTNDVDYSVCLFEGITLLDGNVDEFVFTRAKDRDGSDTVVFRSVIGGQTIHYYDVSNDKP